MPKISVISALDNFSTDHYRIIHHMFERNATYSALKKSNIYPKSLSYFGILDYVPLNIISPSPLKQFSCNPKSLQIPALSSEIQYPDPTQCNMNLLQIIR